jgi:hypothetical protein
MAHRTTGMTDPLYGYSQHNGFDFAFIDADKSNYGA